MKKIPIFWPVQILGWLCYYVVISFIYLTISPKVIPNFLFVGGVEVISVIIITSVLRYMIIRMGVLQKKLTGQILFIFLSAIVVSLVVSVCNQAIEILLKSPVKNVHKEALLFLAWISNFAIIFIWNLLYFAYHYVVKSNKEILDKARLESVVKELELKTIKAHINPHFIFNALNSIRYLVDENPRQARYAITELSKLLRSSMHAENISTTRLDSEIEIVQSYLELEKIRFEERLEVRWSIAPATYDFQVPPMMLQTLVENSIKHGISHQIEGGMIEITSKVENHFLHLRIENTGKLLNPVKNDSFGIKSTRNRLQLLFGDQASFSINESDHQTVVVDIKIPATAQEIGI
ncbi:histidine kinase [Arachidicoccus ginsenosidivorans]|jgi:LytS/YehU family sensor histidine kinase|uniref:Sensor histidine kinase n=1 Tax=Arachidicoccus ginsenosidivorans TaxID=496057 RepID=A0A5B8VLV2_9BACT|nr:histidine kinase [Arachidicoccus ginsenosidivorans]QEC71945.1 sensor histidine kinase [Arachidicoccus ginsenosidivorans]